MPSSMPSSPFFLPATSIFNTLLPVPDVFITSYPSCPSPSIVCCPVFYCAIYPSSWPSCFFLQPFYLQHSSNIKTPITCYSNEVRQRKLPPRKDCRDVFVLHFLLWVKKCVWMSGWVECILLWERKKSERAWDVEVDRGLSCDVRLGSVWLTGSADDMS